MNFTATHRVCFGVELASFILCALVRIGPLKGHFMLIIFAIYQVK